MSRQFVRSLIFVAVLGTAKAGPCKPSGSTTAVSESTMETSTSVVSSVETDSALFTSTTEALTSATDETTIINIQTTTSGAFIESSMSSSETETLVTITAGDVTTTAEASTTTTEVAAITSAASICTPPEGTVCGRQGYRTTNSGQLGQGSAGSLAECMQNCVNLSGCVIAAFKQNAACEMWSEIPGFDGSETSFKWYQPTCFCLDDAAPTN